MGKLLNLRLFDLIFVLFLVPLNFGLSAIADVFVTNSLGFCKLLCCVYSLPSLLAGITAVIFVKRTVTQVFYFFRPPYSNLDCVEILVLESVRKRLFLIPRRLM